MKTRAELAWEAKRIVRELIVQHPHLEAKLFPIQFKVSARMTSAAGSAVPARNLIKISLPYFASEENFAKHFRQMITHEVAHILVPPVRLPGRRKRDSHGLQWQLMDRSLGGTGERCHTLELSEGYHARRDNRIEMPCYKCGKMVSLTQRQAQVYRTGIEHGSMGPGKGYGFGHRRCP